MYRKTDEENAKTKSTDMSGDAAGEVNQATLALKSMLNIGGSPSAQSGAASPKEESKSEPRSGGSKKKKKKKSNQKQQPQQQTPKQAQQQQQQKKKKPAPQSKPEPKQDSKSQKKKKKQQKGPDEGKETFAWSAFQSSPDASALPIPAFVSPQPEKETVVDDVLKSDTLSVPLEDTSIEATKVEAVTVATNTNSEQPSSPDEQRMSNAPASNTGINLAALTSSPPGSGPREAPDALLPAEMHARPQGPPPLGSPPMYTLPPNPHYPHPPHPAGSPYAHQHAPPMGYVTIQVQVPPNLMPGRQMVVASPSGYPVSVTVPDGIAPGMVIPVHVPAGPMMMGHAPSPYQYGGRLMPPPHHPHPRGRR